MKNYAILTEVRDMSYFTSHAEVNGADSKVHFSTRTKKTLAPLVINTESIITVRENDKLATFLAKNPDDMPEGLDERHKFCRITLRGGVNNSCVDVVGDLRAVAAKIWGNENE